MRKFFIITIIFNVFNGFYVKTLSQTNPTPINLPVSINFGTSSFSSMPAGTISWNGLNGNTINSQSSAESSSPTGDATITAATGAQTTGGSYGYASGGDAMFYIQTSSNATNGVNQLVLSINTLGMRDIKLSYEVHIISAQPRTVGVICQYRVGISGSWTSISATTGSNPFSQAGGTTGLKTTVIATLPASANDKSVVQIRWAVWRGTESGNSSGLGIDDISVTAKPNPVDDVALVGAGSGSGTISWSMPSNYNTSTNSILVFLKSGSNITIGTPAANISSYTANAIFGSGSTYENDANAYCVYIGDGNSVTVSNITDGNEYYSLVFSVHGSNNYSDGISGTGILPVQIVSLFASNDNNKITILWTTSTEKNNYGFEIERSSIVETRHTSSLPVIWEKIGFVQGSGNSNSPKEYSFTDNTLTKSGKYAYRLKQIDNDGSFEYSKIVEVDFVMLDKFTLEQNYPNPFNPTAVISYQIPVNSNVSLKLYDVLGNEVATLVNEYKEAGRYKVELNLGQTMSLSSGIYFYKLQAGEFSQVKKMILSK